MFSTSKNEKDGIRRRQGVSLVNVLVGVAVASVLLIALLSSLATYVRSSRSLAQRTKAEELLVSRSERLAAMKLTKVPENGVYGEEKLKGPLAELVKQDKGIQFRLEVVSTSQKYPNYFFPKGPPRLFSDFVRLRLIANWQAGTSDVVLFRSLEPLQEAPKGAR